MLLLLLIASCSFTKRQLASVADVDLACKEKILWPAHPYVQTLESLPVTSGFVASDTFVDNCGNYYRGHWAAGPLKESVSKGRTLVEKIGLQFKGQFETGPTASVPLEEFLYLTELKPGDAEKVLALRSEAFRSGFRLSGNAFVR